MSARNRAAVVGRGMVTSLGLDAVTSCAAARAGLVRVGEIDHYAVTDEEGEIEPAVGHQAPYITFGFEKEVRLMRLLEAALRDLRDHAPESIGQAPSAAFYLSLPDPERILTGEGLIPEGDGREAFRAEAKARAGTDAQALGLRVLGPAMRLCGWQGRWSLRHANTSGATGVLEALLRALADLAAGAVPVAVVAGVDSLLGEETLEWLEATSRLKTAAMPAGLQPGEAAAMFVLRTERDSPVKGATPLCFLEEVRTGEEPHELLSGLPPVGEALAGILAGLASNPNPAPGTPWVIGDQNGEPYRAQEWGNALVRLVADRPEFQDVVSWYPAASFGETGAAGGAAAVCVAAAAFQRGYAPAGHGYLLSTGDGKPRIGALLSGS